MDPLFAASFYMLCMTAIMMTTMFWPPVAPG